MELNKETVFTLKFNQQEYDLLVETLGDWYSEFGSLSLNDSDKKREVVNYIMEIE